MSWIGYYRNHIDIFIRDYLNINLKLFQRIILNALNSNMMSMFLASRGIGKTFLIALYVVSRAILYPGEQICVVSATREQSKGLIDKILGADIMGRCSDRLMMEISGWKNTAQESYIEFHNGSKIYTRAPNDNARGGRAHIMVFDEFRLIDEDIIKLVFQDFTAVPRQPAFLSTPDYKDVVDEYISKEPNQEIYMSSAYYKSHWSYKKSLSYLKSFLKAQSYFICALPYQLAIKENLTDKRQIENRMQEEGFSPTKFAMERECIWQGTSGRAFFELEELNKARRIDTALYPSEIYEDINNPKFKRPAKADGELRILTVDVALMGGRKNDATAIMLLQLLPNGNRYIRQVLYGTAIEGGHSGAQALLIRKLFDDMQCDYIVMDCLGAGVSLYDRLCEEIYDKDGVKTYSPLSCMNDDGLASRCTDDSARKVIYSVKGNAKFNSEIAYALKDDFKMGKIKLLISSDDADRNLKSKKWTKEIDSSAYTQMMLPYIHTDLLIHELVGLNFEIKDGLVKIKERSTARKDRYSSLAYGNYFAKTLERNLDTEKKKQKSNSEFSFLFKAPSVRGNR